MDMLINRGVFSYAEKRKSRGSQVLYLAFPVVAFKVEITATGGQGGNPILNAVRKLNEYYHSTEYAAEEEKRREEDEAYRKMPQKPIAARIADDLALTTELVKRVLEYDESLQEQSLDELEDGLGETHGEVIVENFYAFYDLLSRQYLPTMISESEFNGMKEGVEDPSRYQASLGDSSYKKILYLKASDESYPRGGPTQTELESLSIEELPPDLAGRVQYNVVDWGSKFHLLTACFHFENNPYFYNVVNPFRQRTSNWLRASVQEWEKEGTLYGINLAAALEKIKPRGEADKANKSKTESELDEKLQEFASTCSKNRKIVAALLPRFKDLFLCYSRLSGLPSERFEAGDRERGEIYSTLLRQNYLIALYTFFEDSFARCAEYYYRKRDVGAYRKYIDRLQEDSDNGAELYRLASELGFQADEKDRELLSREKLHPKHVESFIEKSELEDAEAEGATYLLPTSIYINLIEAQKNTEHPFRKLQKIWSNLLSSAIQVRRVRNKAKHGEVYDLDYNYYELYHVATDVFCQVCALSAEQWNKLPQIGAFQADTEWREEFEIAYTKAKAEIEQSPVAKNNVDLRRQLTFEGLSFFMQEVEYYAKLSNLYDELLLQLLQGKLGHTAERIQTELVDGLLKNYKVTDVFECVLAILQKRDISPGELYDKSKFRRRWELKEAKRPENLSVRNKLLYLILCLEAKHEEWLNDAAIRDYLLRLCDNVSKVERLRGHNNRADFNKNAEELQSLHAQAMDLSKMFETKGE